MWVSSCLGGGLCHVMLGPGQGKKCYKNHGRYDSKTGGPGGS